MGAPCAAGQELALVVPTGQGVQEFRRCVREIASLAESHIDVKDLIDATKEVIADLRGDAGALSLDVAHGQQSQSRRAR